MALIDKVSSVLELVPVQWHDEFCSLIEGKCPSKAFSDFYDASSECQHLAEMLLRNLDEDFSASIRGLKKSARLSMD